MSSKSALRPLEDAVVRAVERIWGLGFTASARFVRPNTARWTSSGGHQVLIVAPHPDDEAIGCAGTALLHVGAGDRVCVAIATDGRRSRVIPDPTEMSQCRRREAGVAAQLMRVHRFEWIGLPEGEWSVSALSDCLRALIKEMKPDIIYAPSRIDFHPEHFKVAHTLALVLADADDWQGRVRVYQIQVPLTPLLCNVVADVSALIPQCEAVLRAYTSQAGSVRCAYRQRRYSAQMHGMAEQAEVFWEMTGKRFIELHGAAPTQWPNAFRGLRSRSFSDPLAYLVGRKERWRLHNIHARCP
jgi:LmbE family N-acetylglucosaminyl deacetylase